MAQLPNGPAPNGTRPLPSHTAYEGALSLGSMTSATPAPTTPADEVVRICQELIRIDSSNFGDDTTARSSQCYFCVTKSLRLQASSRLVIAAICRVNQ